MNSWLSSCVAVASDHNHQTRGTTRGETDKRMLPETSPSSVGSSTAFYPWPIRFCRAWGARSSLWRRKGDVSGQWVHESLVVRGTQKPRSALQSHRCRRAAPLPALKPPDRSVRAHSECSTQPFIPHSAAAKQLPRIKQEVHKNDNHSCFTGNKRSR